MYVKAILTEGTRNDGLLVPQIAVSRDPTGSATALVVGAENKVEQRPVTLSRSIGDQWLVENGLRAGERVIVEGSQKAQPGGVVQPVESATPIGSAASGSGVAAR